jgi:DNA-binding transcriptional MerR regulator
MRIGELSRATGVSVRSLRYYEAQDLLSSTRTPSGQRVYPASAIERVEVIQQLLRAGIRTKTMADLLPCILHPEDRTGLLGEALTEERTRIDEQISDLLRTRTILDSVITSLR